MPHEEVLRSMRLFAERLLPALTRATAHETRCRVFLEVVPYCPCPDTPKQRQDAEVGNRQQHHQVAR
jgi:hypothetical protein